MKKVIFISFPFSSHLNPQLELCRELAGKNVQVIFYTSTKYFSKFQGLKHVELRGYPDDFSERFIQLSHEKLHLVRDMRFVALMYFFHDFAEVLLPFLIADIDQEEPKPAIFIVDPFAVWGRMLAKYYNIPLVNFMVCLMGGSFDVWEFRLAMIRSMLIDFPKMLQLGGIQRRIDKAYGPITEHPKEFLEHQGNFTIVPTSREFQPGASYPDNIKFVGPTIPKDCRLSENKHIIFIARGTAGSSDYLWDIFIEASKDFGYDVVLSFGGSQNNKLHIKELPENVTVYDNLTLEEYYNVLRDSILFITHGGVTGISDAILFQTPLLIYPYTPEQKNNAKLIEQYGCGKGVLKKRVTPDALRKVIREILDNKSFFEKNLTMYRESFFNAMGFKQLVKELNAQFNLF